MSRSLTELLRLSDPCQAARCRGDGSHRVTVSHPDWTVPQKVALCDNHVGPFAAKARAAGCTVVER